MFTISAALFEKNSRCLIFSPLLLMALWFIPAEVGLSQSYRKATIDNDVVKEKKYPKQKRLEFVGPDVGMILNESYVTTILGHMGLYYYKNETWGFGIDGAFALSTTDKPERQCIENFYNDPEFNVADECGSDDNPELLNEANGANMGPAYVPIRETKMIITALATWNPLYGKQLFMKSATNYFDMFVVFGAGITLADYYRQRVKLANGRDARGTVVEGQEDSRPGATPGTESYAYGEAGRPEPESETLPTLVAGIGQKYHFMGSFNFKAELRGYMLLGTENAFDTFFTLWGGFGYRF